MPSKPSVEELKKIKAIVVDCDGVLSDGALPYREDGVRSLNFYARDGLGIAMAVKSGVQMAVLSGRPTDIAEARHAELGMTYFSGRCADKREGLLDLCNRMGVEPQEVVFVGDDVADLPAFSICGISVGVADACIDIRERCDWLTQKRGGRGAVREVCEEILRARGDWQRMLDRLTAAADGEQA